jgi:hypothetical protein
VPIDTFKFLILGHPVMRPDMGFIDLLSLFPVSFPSQPFIAIRFGGLESVA